MLFYFLKVLGFKEPGRPTIHWSRLETNIPSSRAAENSRFEGDKFPVLFWKNPENSRLELTTYLQANTSIIARKWVKLTHFLQLHKTQ